MKVLVFLDYFSPAYKAGGPIRIFEALTKAPHGATELFISTQNCDWGDTSPLKGIAPAQWTYFANAKVFYATPGTKPLREIIDDVKPDVIHLNSVFSRVWTMQALFLRRFGWFRKSRFCLSPHGEFSSSALKIKGGRKSLYLFLAKALGLFDGLTWIATAEKEANEIKRVVGDHAKVELAPPPFPSLAARSAPTTKQKGSLRLVFLARLSEMKNIGFLLSVLPYLKGKVSLDVYGPVDEQYAGKWAELTARFRAECPEVHFEVHGPVPSDQTTRAYQSAELFILPSLGENFGYSIVEALAAGTPAVISDRTPWNEIGRHGIGAALSLENPSDWVLEVQKYIDMSADEWSMASARAQEWVRARSNGSEALLKIYGSNS